MALRFSSSLLLLPASDVCVHSFSPGRFRSTTIMLKRGELDFLAVHRTEVIFVLVATLPLLRRLKRLLSELHRACRYFLLKTKQVHGLRAGQECHMKRTKNSILESEQYRAVGGAQSHTKILAIIRTNEGPKQRIDAANMASDNPTTDLVFTWALPLQFEDMVCLSSCLRCRVTAMVL